MIRGRVRVMVMGYFQCGVDPHHLVKRDVGELTTEQHLVDFGPRTIDTPGWRVYGLTQYERLKPVGLRHRQCPEGGSTLAGGPLRGGLEHCSWCTSIG